MTRSHFSATCLAAALLSTACVARADTQTPTIAIVAVVSTFTPKTITLQRGITTRLLFTHIEGVHAIQSVDLGIPLTTLAEGHDASIDVTPEKAGTYVLHCQVVCGPDHASMALTVMVK